MTTKGKETIWDPHVLRRRVTEFCETAAHYFRPSGDYEAFPLPDGGPNPLLGAAANLLSVMTQLKYTREPPGEGLREQLSREVGAFRDKIAKLQQFNTQTVNNASYVVCTALDDIVLNDTAWGKQGDWPKHHLLIEHHQDGEGGAKFFDRLKDAMSNPMDHWALLELMYVCLALGFQGKYRGQRDKLESEREKLYEIIRKLRGGFPERDLSPQWEGIDVNKTGGLKKYLPLWVVLAVTGGLLITVYSSLRFSLGDLAEPVYNNLNDVKVKPPEPPPPTEQQPPEPVIETLKIKLQHVKQVEIVPPNERPTIRIGGSGLFQSGSATLDQRYYPVLKEIAEAINTLEQKYILVTVTGHTDNIPIKGPLRLKFQNNRVLSKARADAVKQALEEYKVDANRLKAEGQGAQNPLDTNATPGGRARNRRVEITIQTDGR